MASNGTIRGPRTQFVLGGRYGVEQNLFGSNHLSHYGVKGMKWGVRKDRRTSTPQFSSKENKLVTTRQYKLEQNKKAILSSAKKSADGRFIVNSFQARQLDAIDKELGQGKYKPTTNKPAVVQDNKGQNVSEKSDIRGFESMTDDELKAKVNRLNLEKQIMDLTNPKKEQTDPNAELRKIVEEIRLKSEYKKLTTPPAAPKETTLGEKFVKGAIGTGGKLAGTLATTAGMAAVATIVLPKLAGKPVAKGAFLNEMIRRTSAQKKEEKKEAK